VKLGIQPKHRDLCARLLQDGILPRSHCAQSLVRALKSLFDAGVVRWNKANAGQRLVIANQGGYKRWFVQHFPETPLIELSNSSRIQAVARFRDSKALRSDLPIIVSLRSTDDGVLLCNGKPIETTRATNEHGVFSFTLTTPSPYSLRGVCALIENLAVFQSFERLSLGAPLAIWATGGTNSNRFLAWLSISVERGLRIVDLPDYDPAGLTAFVRHHRKLGDSVTLYTPEDLPTLFRTYSNASLLRKFKSQRMLMKLRNVEHPLVRRIVTLIDESNRALEHEATLISAKYR
jgi:hypothetical protein